MTTSEQMRAARALLRWEQKDLADAAKVSLSLIRTLEATPGTLKGQARALEMIVDAFVAAGVSFLDGNYASPGGPGVRFTKPTGASLDTNEEQTIQYREVFENDAPPGAGG